MSKKAEKFIEKYTTKDQNDWLVKKKDIIARFMESYHKEQLILSDVSQQRELLKKWWRYFDEESVAVNCNDEEREEVITNFFNCG